MIEAVSTAAQNATPELVRIGRVEDLSPERPQSHVVNGVRLATLRADGKWFAFEDRCPHQGAALSDGEFADGAVVCPLHGWRFSLSTGQRLDGPGRGVACYETVVQEGELWVRLPGVQQRPPFVCLVRYGVPGWVSRFGLERDSDCAQRDSVLVETGRGVEAGQVLAVTRTSPDATIAGRFVRRLDKNEQPCPESHRRQAWSVLERAQALIRERNLPVEVIDGERLWGTPAVILYYLGIATRGLGELAQDLRGETGIDVHFEPAVDAPHPGGGGCGSGGCGSCAD